MTRKSREGSSGPRRQLRASQFALKPAEIRKLIYAAESPRDRCLIRTLAETGIRRAELAALDVRDVDLEVRRLTIRSGKGGKERVVPITPGARVGLAVPDRPETDRTDLHVSPEGAASDPAD